MVEETVEDYVAAYMRHKAACVNLPCLEKKKEFDIMSRIVQGASLKFKIRSRDFLKLCGE